MEIENNDMYIEDSSMMFDQLEDGLSAEEIQVASLGAEYGEAEDLIEEGDFDEDGDFIFDNKPKKSDGKSMSNEEAIDSFDDIEWEEDELDPNAVEEDEDGEEDGETTRIELDGYEVELDNGEVVSVSTAIESHKRMLEVEQQRDANEAERNRLMKAAQTMEDLTSLAKLEIDEQLATYEGLDWKQYSINHPESYAEHRPFYDGLVAKKNSLLQKESLIREARQAAEVEQQQKELQNAVNILSEKIPGFNEDIIDAVVDHAISLGMDEKDALDIRNPYFFLGLYNSMNLEKGHAEAAKKVVKRIKQGPSIKAGAVAKKGKATGAPVGKKASLEKKIASGQASDLDLSDAFDFLED